MRKKSVVCVMLPFLSVTNVCAAGKKIDTFSWSTEVKLPRTEVDQQIVFLQKHDTHAPVSLSADVVRKRSHYITWNTISIGKIMDLKNPGLEEEGFNKELDKCLEGYKRLREDAFRYKSSLTHIFDVIEANLSIVFMITRENINNLIEEDANIFSCIRFSSWRALAGVFRIC